MMNKYFTVCLKDIREQRGYSQNDLAKATGMPPSQISHFETGTRKPSFYNLIRLADVLECSLDALVGRSTDDSLAWAALRAEKAKNASLTKDLAKALRGEL